MTKMRNVGSGEAKGLWKSKPALSTGIYNLRYCSLICYFSITLPKLFVKKESLIHSLSATNDFFSFGGGEIFYFYSALEQSQGFLFSKIEMCQPGQDLGARCGMKSTRARAQVDEECTCLFLKIGYR